MSMTLYTVKDDRRVVNKTLGTGHLVGDLHFDNPSSIMSPRVIIKYFDGLFNYNYCYISEFGRYYYIANIVVMSGKRVMLYCTTDVLYTYASQIATLKAIRLRSEESGPTEITDPNLPIHKDKIIKIYEFEGGDFNIDSATNVSYNFVLNITGGGNAV